MPEETPEISRLVYETYGYTYPHDYVYYPERIAALNEAGRVHSAVAIADGKEIAGHCTLQFPEDNPRIAELALAVVKPEYRSRGCLRALTDYLVRLAEEKGLIGVFTKSVTEHPFSQRTAYRFGFKDCALLVGIVPRDTPFKGLVGPLAHRGNLLVQFRYLKKGSEASCFSPPRHRKMIAKIYANLGIAPEIRTDPGIAVRANGGTILKTQAAGLMLFARIAIERSGLDVVDQVRAELRELRNQKFEIINLYLNLSDPWTIPLTGAFEELGLFFAGLLPAAFPNGDGLILQLLNTSAISYEAVVAETPMAGEMLAYISAHDPNQP
jgi:GNAT superfamily N-acetyltransferase